MARTWLPSPARTPNKSSRPSRRSKNITPPASPAAALTDDEIEVAFLLGNPRFNQYIVAISVAAVFFGANTYIGNGPNFMVKSIADHQKAHAPSFLGYIFRFTVPFMLPVLLVVWWLFFRH